MDTQLHLWQILAANGAIGLGAFVQSTTGFGLGLMAVPMLALIEPTLVPGPFLLVALIQQILMILQNRRGIVADQVRDMGIGVIAGTILACLLLNMVQGHKMGIVFGTTILAAVLMSCCGFRVPLIRQSLWGGGLLCGIMGTISGVGGPPLILVYQHEPGPRVRGNLGLIFLLASLCALPALARSGHFGWHHALLGASLIPGILMGTLVAPPFARYLDRVNLRPILLALSTFGAMALIARDIF